MVEFTMKMELCVLKENESEKWDKIVDSSPYGTIFHRWKFLKIIEKHTNTKLNPIIVYEKSNDIGVFPIFFQNKFMFRAVFSPPPHAAVPYLGPLIIDYDILKPHQRESNFIHFQNKVNDFIFRELKPNYINVVLSPDLLDGRPFMWTNHEVKPQYNYIIDLTKGEECIWSQFQKNLREGITKTVRRGAIVEESGVDGLNLIYDNFKGRYQEQNRNPSISKDYLSEVYNSFHPENLRIFICLFDGEVVGGTINICYKNKISSWLGSAKTNITGLYTNDLTQWECMKWACKNNFKIYEEIGANTERLWQFKSKYNPELSICLNARKYSSVFYKWMESSYKLVRH